MGFFGGGYSRPGKGVTKEEAAKRNYFEIFGRKFSKLLQLNMLYVAVNILFFGGSILLAIPYDWNQVLDYFSQNQIFLLPILPFIPLMFIGPFTAGLTYVIRNYAKQEHAFMASDFFEHSKKNWKQALIVSILSTAVLYLFLETFIFYRNFAATHGISYALVLRYLTGYWHTVDFYELLCLPNDGHLRHETAAHPEKCMDFRDRKASAKPVLHYHHRSGPFIADLLCLPHLDSRHADYSHQLDLLHHQLLRLACNG